jgi:hypothetical protein
MDNSKFEAKLDKIDGRLGAIDAKQQVMTEQLKEHMRRSDLLETGLGDIRKDMRPIQKHVAMVEGFFKGLGAVAVAMTVLSGILKLFKIL